MGLRHSPQGSKQEQAEKLRVDLPILQAIATRTWGKKDELKVLKAELATLDHKITAELAPKQEKQDFGEEVKPNSPVVESSVTSTNNSEKSLVAEPDSIYYRSIGNVLLNKGSSILTKTIRL